MYIYAALPSMKVDIWRKLLSNNRQRNRRGRDGDPETPEKLNQR